MFNLLPLSDEAIPSARNLHPGKYLYSLIFNAPFLCTQSEDVDLLLVSGSDVHLNNKEKKSSSFVQLILV